MTSRDITATVVRSVGKRSVVYGMSWEALKRDAKGRSSELGEMTKRANSQYGVMVQTASGRVMAGLVAAGAPPKARKAHSAAAWLSTVCETPTYYIEQVADDRWWCIFVRPGEIDIATDRILGGAELGALLDDMFGDGLRAPDWSDTVIIVNGDAPPVRLIESGAVVARAGTFAELVSDTKPDVSMQIKRLVGGVSVLAMILLVGVVGTLALAAAWYVMKMQREREELVAAQAEAAEAQRRQVQLATLADKRIDDAVQAALASDTATRSPGELVSACLMAYQSTGDYAAGWKRKLVDCSTTSASAHWEHPRAGLGDNATLQALAEGWGVRVAVDVQGATANMGLDMEQGSLRDPMRSENLPVLAEVAEVLGTWAQRFEHGTSATVQLGTPTIKPLQYMDPRVGAGENGISPVPQERLYRTGTVQVSGRGLLALRRFALDLPYVTVNSVRIHGAGGGTNLDWKVEGIYVLANR